ncbi:MAG: CHASE2 domain-containing protein [Verrucomicrobiota bacterium]
MLLTTALVSLLGTALLWSIWMTGSFHRMDHALLDLTQNYLPPEPVEDSPLVYIKIGDISDQPWPWQSLDYAILTHSILRYFPQAMTMDAPFYRTGDGPTVYDSQLRSQLKRLNQSFVTVPLTSSGRHLGTATALRPLATVPEHPELPVYAYGLWPIHEVSEVSQASPQTFPTDPDGRIRRLPLIINYQGKPVASQVLHTYAAYRGADLTSSGAVIGNSIILKDKQGDVIEHIPINTQGEITLRYYPELPLRKEVEFYSVILASEEAQQGATPPFDLGIFRNSLVMLGKEHPDITETVMTPFGLTSTAKLQLQAMANLLNRTYVKSLHPTWMAVAIYLALAAGILLAQWRKTLISLSGYIACIFYITAMIAMFFYSRSYWADPTAILLATTLGWIAGRSFTPYLNEKYMPVVEQTRTIR